MRTARPTTGTPFAGLKVLNRAFDSAAARCFLFGRDNPTDPFVPRQRRQIFPGRLRRRFQAQRNTQVRRSLVDRTGLAHCGLVQHVPRCDECVVSRLVSWRKLMVRVKFQTVRKSGSTSIAEIRSLNGFAIGTSCKSATSVRRGDFLSSVRRIVRSLDQRLVTRVRRDGCTGPRSGHRVCADPRFSICVRAQRAPSNSPLPLKTAQRLEIPATQQSASMLVQMSRAGRRFDHA